MTEPLRLLLLEDSLTDAELNERELHKAGLVFIARRVDKEPTLIAALDEFRPDLILADYHLPGFDGMRALAICRERAPTIPFIFVSGTMGEELAVASMKAGATDYILKDRLARLPAAVNRALDERRAITEHERAQGALHESEDRYHQLFETIGSGVVIYRPDAAGATFTIQSLNRAVERIEGVSRQDLLGRDVATVFPGVAAIGLLDALQRVARTGVAERLAPARYQDERISGWRENAVYRLGSGEVVAVYDDVTERVEREARIRRLNRTLRTISVCNQVMVRARAEDELLQAICHDLVEVGNYLVVWIAYPDPAGPAGQRTVAWWGDEAAFRDRCERGRDSAQTAVQLPLVHDHEMLGSLTVVAASLDGFDGEEMTLLQELAADLGHGIDVMRTALERNRYLSQLGQAMRGTVAALARTVEIRDPYTSGHQLRVATLAVAIARAMGLSESMIEGLYLGGLIHDIGKIAVPAEILTKPSRLTPIEYQLIQQHALTGGQIVAGIEFPWPLAEMIVQHHERIDGSGYPHGLRGEAMLLESRILAVADVVEAMSSHRPYRAALGMEVALAEIERGKGTQYDQQVVDACVQVIRVSGMQLPEPAAFPG
ncbi:HD domain-containing phosphohydrolase [uncultured Thiodictyon sp.]|uniref:HD domain-containing phosphohydrolase n=1 Tax=uncultured Thiodictyon sp. TaxID=1846217 RepID=UPI0025DBAAE4|nr:HD domain-containing phosphohydrolase [uncultured Thiodictyon sp.]